METSSIERLQARFRSQASQTTGRLTSAAECRTCKNNGPTSAYNSDFGRQSTYPSSRINILRNHVIEASVAAFNRIWSKLRQCNFSEAYTEFQTICFRFLPQSIQVSDLHTQILTKRYISIKSALLLFSFSNLCYLQIDLYFSQFISLLSFFSFSDWPFAFPLLNFPSSFLAWQRHNLTQPFNPPFIKVSFLSYPKPPSPSKPHFRVRKCFIYLFVFFYSNSVNHNHSYIVYVVFCHYPSCSFL